MGGVETDWQSLKEDQQLLLARHALAEASGILAEQAELFALQFASGALRDRGAADALQLFAALIRATLAECLPTVGRA